MATFPIHFVSVRVLSMKFEFNMVNTKHKRCCSLTAVADWISAPLCMKTPTLHQNCVWISISFHGLNELKTTANSLTIKIQLKWVYIVHRRLNTEHSFHLHVYSTLKFYIRHTYILRWIQKTLHFAFSFTFLKVFILFLESMNELIIMNYPQFTLL